MKVKSNKLSYQEIRDLCNAQFEYIRFLEKAIGDHKKSFNVPWWGAIYMGLLLVLLGFLMGVGI